MAITDKVIELSPVNKKKNIIFYIIMGVLLATTVLFLLLFILKPAASLGEVSGLELTTNLYKVDGKWVAVKGEEYTVCAAVGYSGDDEMDTSLDWTVPSAQFTRSEPGEITESDVKSSKLDSSITGDDTTKVVYDFCKFTVNTTATPGNTATITVRTNATDKEGTAYQTTSIEVLVLDMGASDLDFASVTSVTPNTPQASIVPSTEEGIDAVVNLPLIERADKSTTTYTVRLNQIATMDDRGNEMPIIGLDSSFTTPDGSGRYATNAILAETSGEGDSPIYLRSVDKRASDAFSFEVQKTGSEVITVKANSFNSSDVVTKKIRVNVNPIDEFSVITGYKLIAGTVDPSAASAPAESGITEIELRVGGSNKKDTFELRDHIVVTPWNLQKTAWDGLPRLNIAITDTDGKAENNKVLKAGMVKGRTLEPIAPGEVLVTVTDIGASSIGATLKFRVKVSYDIDNFGYGNKADKTLSLPVVTGSKGNSFTVTYLLEGKTVDIKSDEINASLKVSGGSGITFAGIRKGTTDIIDVPAMFGSRSPTGLVTMTATLNFDVSADLTSPVEAVLQPIGTTSTFRLTVKFTPSVEATTASFITEDEFAALIANSDDELVSKYAQYTIAQNGDAVLYLNMSDDPAYFTQFTLGDLIRFTDDAGNAADNSNASIVLSENYASSFSLSKTTADLDCAIRPKYESGTLTNNRGSITFTLGDVQRTLTVVVTDAPEQLMYNANSYNKTFMYGCRTGDIVTREIDVLPSIVTQKYASGAERSPSGYFVDIYVNEAANKLIAVDPTKYASVNANDLPYVYFFALESDANDFIEAAKLVVTKAQADAYRNDARVKAMFAISRNYGGDVKRINLLQDLYNEDYSAAQWKGGDKVVNIMFTLYPCDANGMPMTDESGNKLYTSDRFSVTPIRLIDKIIVGGATVSDESRPNDYNVSITSGSAYNASLSVAFRTGTAADAEPQGWTTPIPYYENDNNLEDITEGAQSNVERTLMFVYKMPTIASGEQTVASVEFNSSNTKTTLNFEVHNSILGVKSLKFYSDEACEHQLDETDIVCISKLKSNYDEFDVIYYKVTYADDDNSNYISYADVDVIYDHNNIVMKGIVENDNGGQEIGDVVKISLGAINGSVKEFTGELKLSGVRNGADHFFLKSIDGNGGDVVSDEIKFVVYTQADSINMSSDGKSYHLVKNYTYSEEDALTLTVTGGSDMPEKVWALARQHQNQNETNFDFGGTTYMTHVSFYQDKAALDSDTKLEGSGLTWGYVAETQGLRIRSNGARNDGVLMKVVVEEWVSDGNKNTVGDPIGEFTVVIPVKVEVEIYAVGLMIEKTAFVTTGAAAGEQEAKLGVVFNNNKAGHNPNETDIEYHLYKDGVDISGSKTNAFYLEKDAGGEWYVKTKNGTLGLDATYTVKAIAKNGVASAPATLSLTTTAKHIAFTSSATVESGKTYTVHDTNDTYNLSAVVLNTGTLGGDSGSITYTLKDMSGNAITANPPAAITNGVLSFNDVGSAEFKVEITSAGLNTLTVGFKLDNAVAKIRTVFEGATTDNGNITLSPVLYDGNTTQTLDISGVTLLAANGKSVYTGAQHTVYWAQNNGIFTIDAGNTTLTYCGVGKADFTVKAEIYPGSNVYIERTFTVETKAPTFSAKIDGVDTASVNIMDLAADKMFVISVTPSVTGATTAITSITNDYGDLFACDTASGIITLNLDKWSGVDLSTAKTYSFKVSATVNGINTANEDVTLYISVHADKSYTTAQFEVVDKSVTPNVNVADGGTLKLINKGKYEVAAVTGMTETLAYKVNGAALTGTVIPFSNVGTVVISASYTKYGKTFNVGTLSFFVTNDGSEITGAFKQNNTSIDGNTSVPMDYSVDSTRKKVTYTIDWKDAGRTFTDSDFEIHYNKNVLEPDVISSAVEKSFLPVISGTTATWTFTVIAPGKTKVFASATEDGAYYASNECNATFTVSAKPAAADFTFTKSDDGTLAPASTLTLSSSFNAPAGFAGDCDPVAYAIVSGENLITLGVTNNETVTAKQTLTGGTAIVRATLKITNGYYAGTVIEKYLEISVGALTKGSLTVTKPAEGAVLTSGGYQIAADANAGTSETASVSYAVTTGSSYASVDNSGKVSPKSGNADGGKVVVTVTATYTPKANVDGYTGARTETETVTLYVAPTKLYATKTAYNVTAGGSTDFERPYVKIDGSNAYVTSVTYAVSGTTELGAVNGEKFDSKANTAGGTVGITVTATLNGVYEANLTLDGGYTVSVRGTTFTVASGKTFEMAAGRNNNQLTLSVGDFVPVVGSANITDVEITGVSNDILKISDDQTTLSIDNTANRYINGTHNDIDVDVFVTLLCDAGSFYGKITVTVKPVQIELTGSADAAKTLTVGDTFTVLYTVKNIGDRQLIGNVSISSSGNNGAVFAGYNSDSSSGVMTFAYTATEPTNGASDTVTFYATVGGVTCTLGTTEITVNAVPIEPEFTLTYSSNGTPTLSGTKGDDTIAADEITGLTYSLVGNTYGASINVSTGAITLEQKKVAYSVALSVKATFTYDGKSYEAATVAVIDVDALDPNDAPAFTSSAATNSGDTYTIANTFGENYDVTYTYRVITGKEAIKTGENEAAIDSSNILTLKNGNKFDVKHLESDTVIVIEVTATVTTAGAYNGDTFKITLDPITVDKMTVTPPEFGSSVEPTDGEDNSYTITNSLSDGFTATYTYKVLQGKEAITSSLVGASDALTVTNDGKFTVVPQDDATLVVIEVTAKITTAGVYKDKEYTDKIAFVVPANEVEPEKPAPTLVSSVQAVEGEGNTYSIAHTETDGYSYSYTYTLIAGAEAFEDGELTVTDDKKFTVEPQENDVTVIIKVTASVTDDDVSDDTPKTLTSWIELTVEGEVTEP